MLINCLLCYIAGFMKITIEGYFAERFINLCKTQNIRLWNIKKRGLAMFSCNISISNFRKIKPIIKKTKCRVKIKKRRGLPFLLERYKKRKVLAILLALLLIGIFAMSNFLWNIEIECDEEINESEIIKIINENGMDIGKLKKEIDTEKVIRAIRYEREDIAWVGISFKGTKAVVKLVKSEEKPDVIKQDEFCNIIATKEGIITKINVLNGVPVVKAGDLVKKGTTLVNGWLEGKYTGIRYVHANAEIEAKVWYSKKEKIRKKQETSTRTGNEEIKYAIKFTNFEINLFKTLSKFENYDTIVENKKLKLFFDIYLPFEIKIIHNYETTRQQTTYSVDDIKSEYVPTIEKEIKNSINDKQNIVNKMVNVDEKDDYVDIEVIYEVLEDIGTEEKIVF